MSFKTIIRVVVVAVLFLVKVIAQTEDMTDLERAISRFIVSISTAIMDISDQVEKLKAS